MRRTLQASWNGTFAAPALPEVTTDAALATCSGCFRRSPITANLARIQISAPAGTVVAGGLSVTSATGRRIRWDLYVASP